ncbi:hypothetical protein RH831_00975 [Halodesulfurarchaeum sp. HSR-GB]|uniref:hypothetical protein n=1 Tax=Halodesulfurarchaeum sp. HSR-GB TaxID=3074077 RepID=UPI002865CA44|nr:hypothetical protein [Halodesulfurarchaeum sp. HSR-GB]MDR5655754.1 hypothetical protein [Halodesulfurarchaeum sp. HSR-GB]
MARHGDLDRFYGLLDGLSQRVGGPRKLKDCTGYMDWPDRGVYFFLEPGETRDSTDQLRVTRVGTHAVSVGSSTSLWDRLKQHYGTGSGSSNHPHGGAHRGSVYRKRVGEAIIEKHDLHDDYPDWDKRWSSIERERSVVRDEEYILERRVSAYIREQPFLWVDLDDEPGPDSDRATLEQNAIALLSNFDGQPIDPRRASWLGQYSPAPAIRGAGLWNVNHVDESSDPQFLDRLENAITETDPL